ncbi:Bug family tripartite tricarboxylate transporter substrate binding protein [Chloroflexota bacterium]
MIVHYNAGGSFDTAARVMAPVLGKYLGTDVVIKNVPGSSGVVGAAELWGSGADGYTIGYMNLVNLVLFDLVFDDMPFEVEEFLWLNQIMSSKYILSVPLDSPINTVEDLIAASKIKPIRLSCSDPGAEEVLSMNAIGIDHTYVTGFASNVEIVTACLKGDADAMIQPTTTMLDWYDSGDMKPILLFGWEKDPFLTSKGYDVPSSADLGYSDLNPISGPRVIAAPPGTPAHIAKAIEEAFLKTLADPEFMEWVTETDQLIAPKNSAETTKIMSDLQNSYGPWKEELAKYITN